MYINNHQCTSIVHDIIELCQTLHEKLLVTQMHVWGAKLLNELQLQTTAGRPFWIGSQNCLMHINNSCCVTVVIHLIWFQFYDDLETVVHTNACLRCKIIKCTSTSNCCRAAILDWIAKLLDAHQQQVLWYCCITLNLISVSRRLRN